MQPLGEEIPHQAPTSSRLSGTAAPSADWTKQTETTTVGQREFTGAIPLGGGMPIKVGEDTIGGVGLSGAMGGQPVEEKCASAGIAKVAEHLK